MDNMDDERAGAVVHRVHNVHTVHRFAGARQSRALDVTARSTTGRQTLGFAGVTSGDRRMVFRLQGHVTLRTASPQHGRETGAPGESGQSRQRWTTYAIVRSVHTVHSSNHPGREYTGDNLPETRGSSPPGHMADQAAGFIRTMDTRWPPQPGAVSPSRARPY